VKTIIKPNTIVKNINFFILFFSFFLSSIYSAGSKAFANEGKQTINAPASASVECAAPVSTIWKI